MKMMEEKCTKFVNIRVADVQMYVCAVDKTFFVMQLLLPRYFRHLPAERSSSVDTV